MSQRQFSAMFIGGPKAGQQMVSDKPRLRFPVLPTSTEPPHTSEAVAHEFVEYEFINGIHFGGSASIDFWVPSGFSAKDAIETLVSSYAGQSALEAENKRLVAIAAPTTAAELDSDMLSDDEDGKVLFAKITQETRGQNYKEFDGILGYGKAAEIFNTILSARERRAKSAMEGK